MGNRRSASVKLVYIRLNWIDIGSIKDIHFEKFPFDCSIILAVKTIYFNHLLVTILEIALQI
jgi:hypothetical protein